MKRLFCFFFLMAVSGCSRAQDSQSTDPEWKATVKVVDESGQPVVGADVTIGYYVPPSPGESIGVASKKGKTDTNGVLAASARSRSVDLSFGVGKDGYYRSHMDYELGAPYQYDPVKWSPSVRLVLKKIGHPIPMYAKRVESKVAKEDEPIGFDLTHGDWVSPHGIGQRSDLFLVINRNILNDREFEANVKLTFPNKGDGMIAMPPEPVSASQLKTPRMAAADGYQSTREWRYGKSGNSETNFGYFFRVQTVLDENGNIKSALYGKIRGDLRFYPGTKAPRAGIGFDYYLNPTPNDRNIEFDPEKNLLKNLKPTEQVIEP